MNWKNVKADINTVLLSLFLIAWLYTEVSEYHDRDNFESTLIERIERIEAYIDKMEAQE